MKHHSILDEPWTYRVAGLTCHFDWSDPRESWLDLSLEKGDERVQLRFFRVHGLEVEAGFPFAGSGMQILDLSDRGMEDSRIEVSSFEQDPAIRFWAQSVRRVSTEDQEVR
jgi:hypothetical protein